MFQKIWTGELVRQYILDANGREPLNSHYFSTHYPSVYAAAERIFGSWKAAIESAGLDYRKIRKYRIWTRSGVLQTIKQMKKAGKSLSCQTVQNSDKPLYMAAIHRFQSWSQAVRAAGIDYSKIRRRRSMTPEEIKSEILALFRRGEDLAYSNMREKHQYLLAAGMKKLGKGSWAAARRKCGIRRNYRLAKYKFNKQRRNGNTGPMHFNEHDIQESVCSFTTGGKR